MLMTEQGKDSTQARRDERQPYHDVEEPVLVAGRYHFLILFLNLRIKAGPIAPMRQVSDSLVPATRSAPDQTAGAELGGLRRSNAIYDIVPRFRTSQNIVTEPKFTLRFAGKLSI